MRDQGRRGRRDQLGRMYSGDGDDIEAKNSSSLHTDHGGPKAA